MGRDVPEKIKEQIPGALGLNKPFLKISVRAKDGTQVTTVGLSGMFYTMLPNGAVPKECVASVILDNCKGLAKKSGIDNADEMEYHIINPEILSDEFKEILHLDDGKLVGIDASECLKLWRK